MCWLWSSYLFSFVCPLAPHMSSSVKNSCNMRFLPVGCTDPGQDKALCDVSEFCRCHTGRNPQLSPNCSKAQVPCLDLGHQEHFRI